MTRTFSLKPLYLLVSVLWMFAMPASSYAWGPEGHRIVARIAARQLKANARTIAFITKILGSDPNDVGNCAKSSSLEDRLACISVWADTVRSDPRFQYTRNEHFVDIPIKPPRRYDPKLDCPNEDCIVFAIQKYWTTLASPSKSLADRALALKFLVHLIGDLHQPLHTATDRNTDTADPKSITDAGGNLKIVSWLGESSNQFGCLTLHAVWDTNILTQAKLDDRRYTTLLMTGLSPSKAYQQTDVLSWLDESYRVAISNAYGLLPKPSKEEFCERREVATCGPCSSRPQNEIRHSERYHLDTTYYSKNKPVVEKQLTRAGLRLAKVLELAASGRVK